MLKFKLLDVDGEERKELVYQYTAAEMMCHDIEKKALLAMVHSVFGDTDKPECVLCYDGMYLGRHHLENEEMVVKKAEEAIFGATGIHISVKIKDLEIPELKEKKDKKNE